MPEMVVVSVLPEEEDALHSVSWCCSLPFAALKVLWIRRTCFIARLTFTCNHSLVGFPVALWQHQLKMCTEVLPECYSLLCGTGALCHLQDVISVLLVSRCSQGAPPVLVWHWSGRCGIFLLFLSPSDLPLPAPAFCPAVGMGDCVVVPVPGLTLLPYLQCRRSWGGTQQYVLFCSLLVRQMSRSVLKSVGLRQTVSCVLGVMPLSQWLWVGVG